MKDITIQINYKAVTFFNREKMNATSISFPIFAQKEDPCVQAIARVLEVSPEEIISALELYHKFIRPERLSEKTSDKEDAIV